MQVNNASQKSLISAWLKIAIPKISCDNLSGEEMYSIHWYVQCMIEDLETCIHVHLCLPTNGFNYSDGFMHGLWWISAYFFISLKVIVYIPSKYIVGNDVTSCIFLSWVMFWDMNVSAYSGNAGISAIALISPHASRTVVSVCVCLCVCLCMHTSVCNTHNVTVN
jgi:hypothetical protein